MKFSKKAIISKIKKILENKDTYGKKKSNYTYNIESPSAKPTGQMHVGHCRGAIF